MKVMLANPRGFCAGVDRAIAIVEQALAKYGAPIYVRHEVVHNRFVVDDLKAKGAVFVEGARRSARRQHGRVLRPRRVEGRSRRSRCARAQGVRRDVPARDEGARRSREDARAGTRDRDDRPCRPPGGRGHDGPVRAAASTWSIRWRMSSGSHVANPDAARLRDADDAVGRRRGGDRRRAEAPLPGIVGPKKDDICYATQNRQDAVKAMAPMVDVVIVVGSPNSSNSNRLREVAANRGVPAYMIDRADELRPEWVAGKALRRRHRRRVGAGGARERGPCPARRVGRDRCSRARGTLESVVFPLAQGTHGVATAKPPEVGRPRSRYAPLGAKRKQHRRRMRARASDRGHPATSACRPPSLAARTIALRQRRAASSERRDLPRLARATGQRPPEESERQRLHRQPGATRTQRRELGAPTAVRGAPARQRPATARRCQRAAGEPGGGKRNASADFS